jgi:hypothetical protein
MMQPRRFSSALTVSNSGPWTSSCEGCSSRFIFSHLPKKTKTACDLELQFSRRMMAATCVLTVGILMPSLSAIPLSVYPWPISRKTWRWRGESALRALIHF